MNIWYVYIVKGTDGSLYTGITTDLKRRILEHNSKRGAKSLFGKLPVLLVYQEEHENQAKASKREREIKGFRRDKKVKLVRGLP